MDGVGGVDRLGEGVVIVFSGCKLIINECVDITVLGLVLIGYGVVRCDVM